MTVWESEKTERKAEGGAAGSAAHHRAGAAAILYDCADFSEYFAVFSDRRILLIAGIVFFTLGAELAMSPMGERVGTAMTQSKKLWVVVALSFCWALLLQYLNRICRCLHSRFRLFRI